MNTPVLDVAPIPATPREALDLAYDRAEAFRKATGLPNTIESRAALLIAELTKLGWAWQGADVVRVDVCPLLTFDYPAFAASLEHCNRWAGFYPEGSETL